MMTNSPLSVHMVSVGLGQTFKVNIGTGTFAWWLIIKLQGFTLNYKEPRCAVFNELL